MKDRNCAYCAEGELVDKFGIKICELPASKVYLFREQSHPGRVIVASRYHVSELVDLPTRERQAFLDDVATVAKALHRLFKPAKVNYGAYGDTGCHLHFHLVPKYREDEFEWGGVFAMNPQRKYLTDVEYAKLAAKIAAELMVGGGDFRKALIEMQREVTADGRIDPAEAEGLKSALEPYAESDATIAEFVRLLGEVTADGEITPEESERVASLLAKLLA